MKTGIIRIVDARPSKKNPNAKYRVVSVGKNGEILQQSEALNDVKAVKTHIKAMKNCWCTIPDILTMWVDDHTKEQKFAKSNFANPNSTK